MMAKLCVCNGSISCVVQQPASSAVNTRTASPPVHPQAESSQPGQRHPARHAVPPLHPPLNVQSSHTAKQKQQTACEKKKPTILTQAVKYIIINIKKYFAAQAKCLLKSDTYLINQIT